jgi:hypothetical protein
MPSFDIAHIREQGVDLVVIPLDSNFGYRTRSEQGAIQQELQARATAAGLAGSVVPVWDAGLGRLGFLAPSNWHPFFRSINLAFVARNINRRLAWQ